MNRRLRSERAGALLVVVLGMAVPLPAAGVGASSASTEKSPEADRQFFETKIQPILAAKCYKCHSHQSEKPRGGLMLDSHEAIQQGGNSGPIVEPGKPENSLLIHAIRYANEDLQMPPKGEKLDDHQIADLTEWVRQRRRDSHLRERWNEIRCNVANRTKPLGIQTRAQTSGAGRSGRRMGAESDRQLHPRKAGSERPGAEFTCQQSRAPAPCVSRSYRPAAAL